MLLDLLNKRDHAGGAVARHVWAKAIWRSWAMSAAAMVGAGDAYYQGVRMTADQALKSAGLDAASNPLPPTTTR